MRASRVGTALALISCIIACTPSADQSPPKPDPVVEDAKQALQELEAANKALEVAKAEAAKYASAAASQSAGNLDIKSSEVIPSYRWKCNDPDDANCIETGPHDAPKLCWQDYCPCDGPETALDRTICRNARGGIEMSDDQWAIGAQARDSKREGDRLNAEMDAILSDM